MSILIVWKSVCRKAALWVAMAALFLGILLCGSLTDATEIPRCGIAAEFAGGDAAADADTDALLAALLGDGLVYCESETALRAAMACGDLQMGAVLPGDLSARLAAGDTRGMLRFLETPNATFASLWRLRITARLLEVYAPHLTRRALADAGVTRTPLDMRAAIDTYLAADTPFRFTYETVTGTPVDAEGLGIRALRGYIALFFLCFFGFFACPFDGEALRRLSGRLGGVRTLFRLVLPGACFVLLLTLAVTAAGLLSADCLFGTGAMRLFPAAACYAVFLSGLSLMLASATDDAVKKALLLSVLALLSVAFCPVFFDLPALLGMRPVRFVLPPSFFFWAARGGVLPAAVALAAWLLGLACCLRVRKSV